MSSLEPDGRDRQRHKINHCHLVTESQCPCCGENHSCCGSSRSIVFKMYNTDWGRSQIDSASGGKFIIGLRFARN